MSQPRFQDLNDWLQWLETLHPLEIDLGLERIEQVAEKLQVNQPNKTNKKNTKVITVAGTNGKGSFIASLDQLLRAQNFYTGAYTSPHLLRYNERICINGGPVSDHEICEAFAAVDQARGQISLSYFEFGTLAALWLFQQAKLDFWLLEVGLGGRLDAVNIVDPDIAVITSIALDHEQWLGNSRDQIALEKAGILREKGQLVLAETDEPITLTEKIQQLQVDCKRYTKDFDLIQQDKSFEFRTEGHCYSIPHLPDLPSPSIAAALQVAYQLQALSKDEDWQTALANLSLAGRYQQLTYRGKELILDVAHNPAAAAWLAQRLMFNGKHNVSMIFAVMADKDLKQIVKPLIACVSKWYCSDLPGNKRAAKAENVANILRSLAVSDAQIELAENPTRALEAATQYNSDTVVVMGSFFTIEYILNTIGAQ